MYLRNIIESLNERWTINAHLLNTSSFGYLLKSLQPTEKDYIAGYVTKKEWNLGSPIVLDILQQSGILTMTDYMLHKIQFEDAQEVQLIFNDLLEAKFSLLANLIENIERTDPRSQLVTQCLEEGFRRLLEDILIRGFNLNKNCLHEIKSFLSEEQLEKVRVLNLKLLLEIEGCSLIEAISQISEWIDTDSILNNSFNELMKEIVHNKEIVLNCLMKRVLSEKFGGWKWYTNIIRKICKDLKSHSVKVIKAFLKEMYASYLVQKNKNFFLIMILTARVVCCADQERFGDYSQWYRNQFSDIRYTISKDDFVGTMEMLQSLISYENDMDILQIYVKTSISPPTLCNDLVLSFKQMCKSKIERLKLDQSGDRRTFDEVVLIDDDDDNMEF